jgi:L-arabinokinase
MHPSSNQAAGQLPDATAFLESLIGVRQDASSRLFFEAGTPVFVARAPGRLDVMGGIADYSGSLVLQMPTREATFAALQPDASRRLTILSLSSDRQDRFFEINLDDFELGGEPLDYEAARLRFATQPSTGWAGYVAGVFLVLMRERGVRFGTGARILISSDVPEGKGVSSSAALEVATMRAAVEAFSIAMTPRDLALLCQLAENRVVGAACGVMDQMASCCGETNRLLALLCQPAELQEAISVPREVRIWGLDSGVRHSVAGSDYTSVRVGAFMGYRIIADVAQLRVKPSGAPGPRGRVSIDDPRWRGYLANLNPSEFERTYSPELPDEIEGEEFIRRYGGTSDAVTRVEPDRMYAVRLPTAHPVYEHERVLRFAELMKQGAETIEQRIELGELMYQSHASYSACGLGTRETDLLIELVRAAGPTRGMYGARMTGGGSGGTVAVLGQAEAAEVIEEVAQQYAEQTGHSPHVFSGSSSGAAAFGCVVVNQ